MLYLSRKLDESIVINNNIEIKVVEIKGKNVKLGISFPPDVSVLRKELYEKINAENLSAIGGSGDDLSSLFGDEGDDAL